MTLAAKERAILAHVVADPDAWAAHAEKTVGPEAVAAKIEKYRAAYDAEKSAKGAQYKTRAQRDALESK